MLLAVTVTFTAVFFIAMALFLGVNAARHSPEAELKRRLRRMEENDDPAEEIAGRLLHRVSPTEEFIYRLPLLTKVKRLVEQAGVRMKPSRLMILIGSASFAGFSITFLLKKNIFYAFLVAAAVAVFPLVYFNYRRQQREFRFTEQLPDALTMIARSLRAGHALTSAVELVGQELAEPAGGLFKIAHEQQKLGMKMTDSLAKMQEKVESIDLGFFVTILMINREIGGNLSEILDQLAETIRSRLQVRRQVDVYTAEGRLSGYVLTALPVVMFGVFHILRPGYMDPFFTDKRCQLALAATVLAQVAGFFMMRKIVNIRI